MSIHRLNLRQLITTIGLASIIGHNAAAGGFNWCHQYYLGQEKPNIIFTEPKGGGGKGVEVKKFFSNRQLQQHPEFINNFTPYDQKIIQQRLSGDNLFAIDYPTGKNRPDDEFLVFKTEPNKRGGAPGLTLVHSRSKNSPLLSLNLGTKQISEYRNEGDSVTIIGDGYGAKILGELEANGVKANSVDIAYNEKTLNTIIAEQPELAASRNRMKEGDIRWLTETVTAQKLILSKDVMDALGSSADRALAIDSVIEALAVGGEARLSFRLQETADLIHTTVAINGEQMQKSGIQMKVENTANKGESVLIIKKTKSTKQIKPSDESGTLSEVSVTVPKTTAVAPETAKFLRAALSSKKDKRLSIEDLEEHFVYYMGKFKGKNVDQDFTDAVRAYFKIKVVPLISKGDVKVLYDVIKFLEIDTKTFHLVYHGTDAAVIYTSKSETDWLRDARRIFQRDTGSCVSGCNFTPFLNTRTELRDEIYNNYFAGHLQQKPKLNSYTYPYQPNKLIKDE